MTSQNWRVITIDKSLLEQFRKLRDAKGLTNETLIDQSVEKNLSRIVEALNKVGFKPSDDNQKARWSFSEETLAALGTASAATGLPGAVLLRASLALHTKARKPRARKGGKR